MADNPKTSGVSALRKELGRLADADIARHSQRFFKTGEGQYGHGDRFLGIRVPVLRRLARTYSHLSIGQAANLLESRFHEERLLALILLVNIFKKAKDHETRTTVYELYLDNTQYINNWDLVDISAENIVGAYLRQADKKPLYDLAASESLWERRIAMMATFHLIRHNEFADALKIARLLLEDKHDLIHKAVGWMLREIGNRDIETEERFLKKHYRKMPRTMLRYAIEKFPEDRRRQYLKGQI